MSHFVESAVRPAVIKVIGVGGGGCNAINNMIDNPINGVEYISANTDAQSLQNNNAPVKIQLGGSLTRGLGAGADPKVGREAAEQSREEIAKAIDGADMLFITTGMGGGTGTGATPVIAKIAKEKGILTVAVVSRPFKHEKNRIAVAQEGIEHLKGFVNSLLVVPNDKLAEALGKNVTVKAAFRAANDILRNGVAGITDIITRSGDVNVDFADVKMALCNTGSAILGVGEASGEERAKEALNNAISSPLLDDVKLDGAQGLLVNITTAPDGLRLGEYEELMELVSAYADPHLVFSKFGLGEDPTMDDETIRVTIVATGLRDQNSQAAAAPAQAAPETAYANARLYSEKPTEVNRVIRSGRDSYSMNLVAADFANQSVLDSFETSAWERKNAMKRNLSED